MRDVRGNTEWSGYQLHVRKETWTRRYDARNSTSLRVLRFSEAGDVATRQRDECHRRVCGKVARERERERLELCFVSRPKQVTRAMVLLKQYTDTYKGVARCHQTQIETYTGLQLSVTSPAIPFAVRYAGIVLSRWHSEILRKNAIQISFWRSTCVSLVRVW